MQKITQPNPQLLHEFPTKNHPNIIGHALDKGAKVSESGASNKWSKLSMAHPWETRRCLPCKVRSTTPFDKGRERTAAELGILK